MNGATFYEQIAAFGRDGPGFALIVLIEALGSTPQDSGAKKLVTAAGLPAKRAQEFHCPVGLPFGSNDPREIALSIAARLLTERDRPRASRA